MTRVRLLQSVSSLDASLIHGQLVEVSDDVAVAWVADGIAAVHEEDGEGVVVHASAKPAVPESLDQPDVVDAPDADAKDGE